FSFSSLYLHSFPTRRSSDLKPLVIEEDTPVTILLSHLTVTDTDNVYPDDFSIVIQSGANYTYSGATVTPALDYTGTLIVTLRVKDRKSTRLNSSHVKISYAV